MLLTSDKAAANFSIRSLLKNLGHWLGMITLAKNKPILHTVGSATKAHVKLENVHTAQHILPKNRDVIWGFCDGVSVKVWPVFGILIACPWP